MKLVNFLLNQGFIGLGIESKFPSVVNALFAGRNLRENAFQTTQHFTVLRLVTEAIAPFMKIPLGFPLGFPDSNL